MAQFIPEPSEKNGWGWGIDALDGNRLEECRRRGEAMALVANPVPGFSQFPRVNLFLRVTNVGLRPRHTEQAWDFRGYVSDRRDVLEGRTLDALDPDSVQFVEGMRYDNTGFVSPREPGTGKDAPGADPWLVLIGKPRERVLALRVEMARSRDEVIRRLELRPLLSKAFDPYYEGELAWGTTYVCCLRRIADIPSTS